ncbi:MAG: hypothetical protein HOP19_13370 [Acidobacteria bacterium]|nr:hypothetical protein [Acidobacteriota bacterium]
MKFKICLLTCLLTMTLLALAYAQNFGTREDNMSYNGTRITYHQRPEFSQCQADCANNANCQGFTWIQAGTYNANDAAMCYLMSAVTGRSPARGHYSAVKTAAGGGAAYDIDWATAPTHLKLRGKYNQRFAFRCKANGAYTQIWGTDIYTDDSRICVAAAHAGLITKESGGTVAIEMLPGQARYQGSTRYGVESTGYEKYDGSYRFVR